MKNVLSIFILLIFMGCNNNSTTSNSTQEETTKPNTLTKEPGAKPTPSLEKKEEEKAKTFEGIYVYMADANIFTSCDGKYKMPVEMKGEYLTLERRYLKTVDGGEEVYVRLKGEIRKVPPMEGDKDIDALYLTEILEMDKDKKCK